MTLGSISREDDGVVVVMMLTIAGTIPVFSQSLPSNAAVRQLFAHQHSLERELGP